MALIRNEYGGGATSRRQRDGRGRYMEMDHDMPRQEYTDYMTYDEYAPQGRQMGFGEAYGGRAYGGEMMGAGTREMRAGRETGGGERRGMSAQDVHLMNGTGGRSGMRHMEDYRQQGGMHKPLTREKAEEWVESMQNEDPNREEGECWSLEEVKAIAKKMGMPTEGKKLIEFYAAINAMYSDYYKVAEKFDLVEDDFFAELAKAFINDKDAVKDKVSVYYDCIVKK